MKAEVGFEPKPVQKPHPPLYLAATLTQATLEFVSTMGHPLMIGVVLDTANAVDLCNRFVDLSKKAGHDVPMSSIPFFRYFWVAETEKQARKDAEVGLNWTLDMLQWRRTFTQGSVCGQNQRLTAPGHRVLRLQFLLRRDGARSALEIYEAVRRRSHAPLFLNPGTPSSRRQPTLP